MKSVNHALHTINWMVRYFSEFFTVVYPVF